MFTDIVTTEMFLDLQSKLQFWGWYYFYDAGKVASFSDSEIAFWVYAETSQIGVVGETLPFLSFLAWQERRI